MDVELFEIASSTDESRFGERAAAIGKSHDKIRLAITQAERPFDNRQVGKHRVGRLISIAWVFTEQTLHDFVERTRHFET